MIDYPIGIEESLRDIFSGVLIGGIRTDNPLVKEKINITKVCLSRFMANFPSNIFTNEYAIFYDIIVNLNAKTFTKNQLSDLIDNNRDLILKSPYVDLSRYAMVSDGRAATDDEKVEAFKLNLIDMLIDLSNSYVTEEEFSSACVIFIDWFKNQFMLDTAQSMTRIMSDIGYEEKQPGGRLKKYKGMEDAQRYYNDKMKIIRELNEESRVKSFKLDTTWYEQELNREKVQDDKTLFTFGLSEVDEVLGELRRSNMLGILGPPKGGKTRFSNFIVQRALSLGLNVAVWPLEGTPEEWISMQTAAYIKRTTGVSLNSKDILQRKYSSDPRKSKYISSAKLALSTDTKLGRLSFIEGIAYVEDFLDVLQSHYENENPFDVIVIDSLVNIQSKTGRGKVERISEAYMNLKSFISNRLKRPALAVVPAQLKQSAVDFLRKNPEETIDVTAGGESAETIRTPDEVIGLFSSKEERNTNIMHIYSVASRHSGNFDDFMVKCDLQCCHFYSEPTLNS